MFSFYFFFVQMSNFEIQAFQIQKNNNNIKLLKSIDKYYLETTKEIYILKVVL